MATIYSNRNDNSSNHVTVNPNSTGTWVGGVVPSGSDQVYAVGRRTQINQAAFAKWTGTRTITVDSTSNFASTGFFYVNTNGGEIVKVNYTGTTSTTFTGCAVDETDSFYTWDSGQTIPDNAYVHNPAYVIEIGAGQTFTCSELFIQEGGWVFINGGELIVNLGVYVRDGRLINRNGTLTINRPSASLTLMGFLIAENYPLSIIDMEGDENRVYATLQSSAVAGDTSITVNTPTNGSFAVGDEIALFQVNQHRFRNLGYVGYRDASANFADLDEGLDVVGVSGNTIHVGRRNSARGTVKHVATLGAQKVVDVKPESIYFNAGDKVVINNVAYTVDAVEDSEITLYDYDFTNPATDLSDFWVDASDHVYSSGWSIESGVGLRNTTGGYRELINKYFWSREVVVEADMSPLSGYSSGTRGSAAFGICAAYDPSFRWGHRGYDSFKTDYLAIDDANQDLTYMIRSMSNYVNNRPDRVTSILNLVRGPVKYRVDSRKMRTTVTMNGEELTTEFRRDGHFKGLVGIYTNGNTNFRCQRLVIKQPTQKLYLTTTNSIPVDSMAYVSGIDHSHPVGTRVLKIASVNTGNGSHRDYNFAYRGQYGNGEWPLAVQINGVNTTNSSLPYTHNHDANPDYYIDLGNATTPRSITYDLGSQKTFTHVSFDPRVYDVATAYGFNGVAVYGSNDLTNWTTLYGPTNDTKKFYQGSYNRFAFYPTGTVSYRYVKFETSGAQASTATNRYANVGVHNFSEGYTLELNNASDFNIGDTLTVMSDSGYHWASREYEGYYACTTGATNPENYWHGGWMMECTVTNKIGNKVYLDRPVFWGYVEGDDSVTVVKTNRNAVVRGTISPTGNANDYRFANIYMNDGGNLTRKYLFKGVRFDYIGSYRYSGSSASNRGIITNADDYWNHMLIDGCVSVMGQEGQNWGGIGCINSNGIVVRNSYIASTFSGVSIYSQSSQAGSLICNNKFQGVINGIYTDGVKAFSFNYNEIATHSIGIYVAVIRTDRGTIPAPKEMRFNYCKGSSDCAFRVYDETEGPRRSPRIKIEYNKARAMDDYAVVGQSFSASPYISSNFMAEHTGSRMSRYRNEGFIAEGDASSDLTWYMPQHNIGNFGYDLTHTVYYYAEKDYSRPNVTRIYTVHRDNYFWALGMELDVLENNIPFQVKVKFDYRIPTMATLQDDGTDVGRLRIYSLQRGEVKATQYGLVPSVSGNDWNTFEGTFTFDAREGHAGVFLNRSAQNGYMDIKNSSAYVLTDSPNKIRVVGNTFNLERIWEQYGEVRDTKPLTNATSAINIRKLRF